MAYELLKHVPNIQIKQQVFDHVYSFDLQMYIVPPSGHINLDELHKCCIDRLRVLKLVEQVSKQNFKKSFKHCQFVLIRELEKNGLINFAKLMDMSKYECLEDEAQLLRKKDSMSHFILRSAFSLNEKKQWLYKQEVKLFKWRLSALNKETIKKLNYVNGLQIPIISEAEKCEVKECLEFFCAPFESVNDMNFYKVYFTEVINLVAKRQVFLKNGIAYVPETQLFWITVSAFKKKLNEGFAYARVIVSKVYDDERITNIFTSLRKYANKKHFKYDKYKNISVSDLDELSQKSYPLCMRVLHETLRETHHLTNGGRVQYCLFLKGIGLKLNDALRFWKEEFTKRVNLITFEREYKYFVRHLYGREGKRANYIPFHCFKIFNSKVGLRDTHGCPFKCMTNDLLKQTLSKHGLIQSEIKSIIQHSKNGSYFKACKEYYEITHNCITDKTINHPNVYFSYSRRHFRNIYSGVYSYGLTIPSEVGICGYKHELCELCRSKTDNSVPFTRLRYKERRKACYQTNTDEGNISVRK